MLAGKKLESDVVQAFELRMGNAVVHHKQNLLTVASQVCIPLPYPFLKQNTSHQYILVREVCDWQFVYVYTPKTPWLSALADHCKFLFIAASHFGTAEDCDSIPRFL